MKKLVVFLSVAILSFGFTGHASAAILVTGHVTHHASGTIGAPSGTPDTREANTDEAFVSDDTLWNRLTRAQVSSYPYTNVSLDARANSKIQQEDPANSAPFWTESYLRIKIQDDSNLWDTSASGAVTLDFRFDFTVPEPDQDGQWAATITHSLFYSPDYVPTSALNTRIIRVATDTTLLALTEVPPNVPPFEIQSPSLDLTDYAGETLRMQVTGNLSLSAPSGFENGTYDLISRLDLAHCSVPLPPSIWLLTSGLMGLMGLRKKSRK